MEIRSSKAIEKQRASRSFEDEFEISIKSLELIENLEENITLPKEWVEGRQGRLRPLAEHFGKAPFPAIRLMQGVYPPIELSSVGRKARCEIRSPYTPMNNSQYGLYAQVSSSQSTKVLSEAVWSTTPTNPAFARPSIRWSASLGEYALRSINSRRISPTGRGHSARSSSSARRASAGRSSCP